MKKVIAAFTALIVFTVFAVFVIATPSTCLYLLNWGEYIDRDLVAQFEEAYHCQVIEENVTSSEAMYQKITSKTTSYDVAIPGDYTVHQLYDEGYLLEMDVRNDELPNLKHYETHFNDSLSELMDSYGVERSYFMPYFWGSYCMVYSTRKDEIGKVAKENGFSALYDRSLYSQTTKIGMYDTARWIVASYLLSKGYDPNITSYDGSKEGDLSKEIESDIINALKTTKFNEFGNDQLKRNVANGSLDLCFTQLGDFFDVLYLMYSESKYEIQFNVNVPKTTAAFFDSMVIPCTSQNQRLANEFINFMLDPDHAYQNALAIGYSPTVKEVKDRFEEAASEGENYFEDETRSLSLRDFLSQYPNYLDPLYGTENVYMLEPKSNEYLTTCETIFNSLA